MLRLRNSPLKKLTREQEQLVEDILSFTSDHLKRTFQPHTLFTVMRGPGKALFYHNCLTASKRLLDRINPPLSIRQATTSWSITRRS